MNTLRRTFEYAISMVLGVDYVVLFVACSKCRIKKNQDQIFLGFSSYLMWKNM